MSGETHNGMSDTDDLRQDGLGILLNALRGGYESGSGYGADDWGNDSEAIDGWYMDEARRAWRQVRAAIAAEMRAPGDEGLRARVLAEVDSERTRQVAKWGEQNCPDGTGPDLILRDLPVHQEAARADHLAQWAGDRCKAAPDDGGDTYERILTEEWAEAIAERDPMRLRAELVQVAAVAVQWVEAIDRRAALSPAAQQDLGERP